MHVLHDTLQGIHLLHWLTGAVPVATLLVVSGWVSAKKAAHLLLLGVALTLLTTALSSVDPELSHVRYGAPLPLARAGFDSLSGDLRTSITVLRACFVADLLFWCSGAVLVGAVVQGMGRHGDRPRPRRR
ncbi:hypothetical protein [Paraliomyxa miuraensis]|uniref:hypothetical protein n=1 Tax=Paraliomyxa miuraensis TaxID=376150 RepID=UPI00224FBCB0|nr:hypothetical protein [Paraliomyxa miuraensis]MCX4247859.1 hypothetical protein [Paraliomyxa miuraensis]